MSRRADVQRFYRLLSQLERQSGSVRRLCECTGRSGWPQRGVYFFYDPIDARADSGTGPRIVRVGTHALTAKSRTTLWKRLSTHRGTAKNGGGNHRSSIFRLLVGESLMLRDGAAVPTWGEGNSSSDAAKSFGVEQAYVLASERELEAAVSRLIGQMPFVCLPVEEEAGTRRGFIERNAIALLSNLGRTPIDPPSAPWLGLHSGRERVRASGLWNNNHTDETHDDEFLDELERAIEDKTTGPR
jgi:hypothetical protein